MTTAAVTSQIDDCIERFERGELSADHLRSLREAISSTPSAGTLRQDVLYMQTVFSSVTSRINGISMICDGQVLEMPDDPEDWPYASVLEAINDGWRIVSFPNMALMMDDARSHGVGNEFILERISYR